MKKILLSMLSIAAVGAVAFGATTAFFTDVETSEDNVFAAGSIDLQVDYDCYFNEEADGSPNCPWQDSSWEMTDLGPTHKFFDFEDLKPGDFGEGTISLHVFDNDAWGRLVIGDVQDLDNSCPDPEFEAEPGCLLDNDGELREALLFRVWLDEGFTPGFQGIEDEGEGDNFWDERVEPLLISRGTVDAGGETHNIWDGLALAYAFHGCTGDGSDISDCPGLARDGHIVGSITYYFGIDWVFPSDTGNEAQTDSLGADMTIEVEQYRNNPTPFTP